MSAYQEQVKLLHFSFVAQIVLFKGDSPWKLVDLKSKLSIICNLKDWRFISLGHDYFHVMLNS